MINVFVALISHDSSLLGFFMNGMRLAELAVLFKFYAIGIVLLVLVSIVVPLLADRARESYLVTARILSHVVLR